MGFQCRQFYIKDDQCAMKVSTDSLILGSYVPVIGVSHVLDLGTGSGLLALMLAQRAPATQVTALELEPAAVLQAQQNVAASPWPHRIQVRQADVQDWREATQFELVVCNPPYFNQQLPSASATRELARQGTTELLEWAHCAAAHLSAGGRFYWILPLSVSQRIATQMAANGWYLVDSLAIKTTARKPVKLMVQGWQREPAQQVNTEQLTVHEGAGYSTAFRRLTGEFYLAGQST